MRIIASLSAMQSLARRWKRTGVPIGFVPTMGCLHDGHLSLIARARRAVGHRGVVVVSIYVNPAQFEPREDFASYPRQLRRDATLCRRAGTTVLFTPNDASMYPPSDATPFSTWVGETDLTQWMEGVSRPGHFRGVTTIVAKLFHLVLPDVAIFGAKDFQQAAVLRRMTRDLNFPGRLIVAPTVREKDGLALSSRNRYLSKVERVQAPVLWKTIQLARKAVRQAPKANGASSAQLRRLALRSIGGASLAKLDYVEFFDPETLRPVMQVRPGCQMALAVRIGRTRLIDNGKL